MPEQRNSGAVEPSVFVAPDVALAGEPRRAELILKGRVAFADLGVDPDDWVDAETEAELEAARPKNTVDALRWAFGALIYYCGKTGRRHDPPTSATVRQWVKDHWEMTKLDKDGNRVKRGRGGAPLAPATVATRVYLIAMICNRLGWLSPTKDKLVADQLDVYRQKFENAGFRTHEADPMTPELSVALVRRACDLATINGLRNATMFRLQFDTGCRASELCDVMAKDIVWETDERVLITFVKTKGRKPRTVAVEAIRYIEVDVNGEVQFIPNPDWDTDPVRLLGLYDSARTQAGLGKDGPFFTECSHASQRRKDWEESGVYAGKILRQPMTYNAYVLSWNRAVTKSRINIGPRGTVYRFPSHANRAGLITASVQAGIPLEDVGRRTGHAKGSPVLAAYYRSDRLWGDDNPGVRIRRQKIADDAKRRAAAAAARRSRKKG